MGIDLWFQANISASRPPILKVKVLKWPPIWGICFNAKKSGFPVQPDEKIRKSRVLWSTYRESCYHTFVVHHILHFLHHHTHSTLHTQSKFETQTIINSTHHILGYVWVALQRIWPRWLFSVLVRAFYNITKGCPLVYTRVFEGVECNESYNEID